MPYIQSGKDYGFLEKPHPDFKTPSHNDGVKQTDFVLKGSFCAAAPFAILQPFHC